MKTKNKTFQRKSKLGTRLGATVHVYCYSSLTTSPTTIYESNAATSTLIHALSATFHTCVRDSTRQSGRLKWSNISIKESAREAERNIELFVCTVTRGACEFLFSLRFGANLWFLFLIFDISALLLTYAWACFCVCMCRLWSDTHVIVDIVFRFEGHALYAYVRSVSV